MPSLAALLKLPRPEYAKQTELVLVDLLWKSPGSVLGASSAIDGLPKRRESGRAATRRLVVEQLRGQDSNLTETRQWVLAAADGLFTKPADAELFGKAVLESISAPRSRNDKSRTSVPVHRGVLPFQTLHGAVNKDQPPDLALAVETMAVFGGANAIGDAAALIAHALDDLSASDLDRFFEHVAPQVWQSEDNRALVAWPATIESSLPRDLSPLSGTCLAGPPRWFWKNWAKLLDPAAGWRSALPERRFMDWATCLLRTGLAMTYLWESALFRALRDFRVDGQPESWGRLKTCLQEPVLLTVHPPTTPITERNIGPLLTSGLGDGYFARAWFETNREHDLNPGGFVFSADEAQADVLARLQLVGTEGLDDAYRDPRLAPKTLREFVRYLLLARSSNDAAADEADFYYLARGDRARVWVEPGPEWLVVVASLAAGRPGGQCTLREVAEEFRSLGLRIDRSTLVALLEGAGLTQDSPDADDAIVVSSGF